MTVYVDDMKASYGRMVMCHMIADTDKELHAMADAIGVRRKWFQHPGSWRRHYDIALSKRKLAVKYGAREVTTRELVMVLRARREKEAEKRKPTFTGSASRTMQRKHSSDGQIPCDICSPMRCCKA